MKIKIILLMAIIVAMTGCNTLQSNKTLSSKEIKWAKVAWIYFENNYNPATGLTNMLDGYYIASPETMAENLIATMAAYEIGLISQHEFDGRITNQISFLNQMKLNDAGLPALAYDTRDWHMVDFSASPNSKAWDAEHISRLLTGLVLLKSRYPQYQEYIDRAVLRMNLCALVDTNGNYLSSPDGNEIIVDGTLGTKEYYSRGFQAWGFNQTNALKMDNSETERYHGIDLLVDARDERMRKAMPVNAVTTTPYALDGMEYGWENFGSGDGFFDIIISKKYKQQAEIVYKLQELRYRKENIFTARTAHRRKKEPYFLIDAVYANGYFWNTISSDGKYRSYMSIVSVEAAFALWALWDTDYTYRLINSIQNSFNPLSGWMAGREEDSGRFDETVSASTNAMVLEAIWYKLKGQLYKGIDNEESFYKMNFNADEQCRKKMK